MAMSDRIWEIDFIRGLAIILMVAFHLVVDLTDFYGYNVSYLNGFWYYEGKLSASVFILVAGVSATLHHRHTRRGAVVLAWAGVISAATYIYNPDTYIRFGILHLLGSCMLLFHCLQTVPHYLLLLAGLSLTAAGPWISSLTAPSAMLIPFGLTPANFVSLDYYPLIPWAGLFLCGAALGKTVYYTKKSLLPKFPGISPVVRLGRHSLAIYLVHQPVLLTLLWVYHHL